MTTATAVAPAVMQFCAHCARPVPDDRDEAARAGWNLDAVTHGVDVVVTVAVCPTCRLGTGPAPEDHEPGSCSGHYAEPDAYLAVCTEPGCDERWACWDRACVEGWRDEHHTDPLDCDCPNCPHGHHDTKLHEPEG